MKNIILLLFITSSSLFSLGNPLYNPHLISIYSEIEGGLHGSKDFLYEKNYLSYSMLSKNHNQFTFRFGQTGYFPGLFSYNLISKGPITSIYSGFEYSFKFIQSSFAFSLCTDTGFAIQSSTKDVLFFLNAGAGIGSRAENGIFFEISTVFSEYILANINIYLVLFRYLSLHGQFGLFNSLSTSSYNTYLRCGLFPGFQINNYFRLTIGGGFTATENFVFGFYTGIFITTSIPVYKSH